MRLLSNTDDEGNIIQSVYGDYVVDDENEYEFHLEITQEQADNLQDYKIVGDDLVQK